MESEENHSSKITSFFTAENIEFYHDPKDIDLIVLKLLENLALNYGIGNVNSIYKIEYKNNNNLRLLEVNGIFKIFTFPLADTENTRVALSFPQVTKNEPKQASKEIIIVITYPKSKPDIILKLIKTLRDFFNDQLHLNKLRELSDSTDIWNYFNQHSMFLPDIIFASDYMEKVDTFLNESNNLKDAINMFIQTGYLNIPVIDVEGNLVGEVTARELMEVCLPRYILWMDDIDPIIHFEPFQNMLAQEDNTWLAEILNYNMAVVQKNEPLMKVAIQMTKKEVSHVYVLDDNKLLGIIRLQYFLNRILRA